MSLELALSLLLPLLQVASVDQGLALLEAGEPLPEVEPAVGRAAAERLARAADPLAVRRLAALARAGGAEAVLGEALVRVAGAGQGPALEAALAEASCTSADALRGDLSPVALAALVDHLWGEVEEPAALGAVLLVAPRAAPDQVVPLAQAWSADPGLQPRAALLLEGLARSARPLAAYDALLGLELAPAGLALGRAAALRELVRRSPEVADEALARSGVDAASADAVAAVVRSLGGVPLSDELRWRQAADLLVGLLAADRLPPGLLSAALLAAGELLVPEVVALLPGALRHADAAVRAAAAAAMAQVGYRDGPTIDALARALEDPAPEVAEAALAALARKSGQRLPAQPELWRRWRAAAALPDQPPQAAAERLFVERQLRAEAEVRQARPAPFVVDRSFASRPRRVPGAGAAAPRWSQDAPVARREAARQVAAQAAAATGAEAAAAPSSALRAGAAASLALVLVGVLLALPSYQRRAVQGGRHVRSIARDVPTATTRRPTSRGAVVTTTPGPEGPLQDAEDELEAAAVPGLSVSSASFAGLVVGPPPASAKLARAKRPERARPLVLPLGTAARAADDVRLEGLLAALPRVPRLASLSVQLAHEGGEAERRVLFRAGQAGGLAPALATLRALGPLVADVTVAVEDAPLHLRVFERAAAPAAGAAPHPAWERLLVLVAQDGALFDELEVLACGVWRRVQRAGEEPTATLVRLASLGPELVDEVRGLVKGGTRVRLHERSGRPRPPGSPWAQLVEGLQRRAHAVVALEVDDGSGWRTTFSAGDAPRFADARALLLDRAGPARALLRGSGLALELPDDPSSRDALVEELGLDAIERLEQGGAPLFRAQDAAGREQALQELVRAGPERLRAVRAALRGDVEATELAWSRDGSPAPAAREVARPERTATPDLDSARLDRGARERAAARAGLARALDGLARLAPGALAGLEVGLAAEAAPVALTGGAAGLSALRALAPLVTRLAARLAGCPLPLALWEGPAAAAPGAGDGQAARGFLRGLEATLGAFAAVEVREAGRLWRSVKDGATTELDALAALGALPPAALREVRATVAGCPQRVTLFRAADAPGPGAAWTAALAELHRLAPTLESITLVAAPADAPARTLFLGDDAARFGALRARLSGWDVERLALRVQLRASGLELPVAGGRDEVVTALEELGPAAVQSVRLDEPGAAPLFEARDAAPLGAAIGTLAALDPESVGEVRVREAGRAERVLFPLGR